MPADTETINSDRPKFSPPVAASPEYPIAHRSFEVISFLCSKSFFQRGGPSTQLLPERKQASIQLTRIMCKTKPALPWLLGVEEEHFDHPLALSPEQLALVQAITVETLSASDKTRRKNLFFWLPYGLILLLFFGLFLLLLSNLDLRKRIQLLELRPTNVIYSGEGNQSQNQEFNDFGYEILSADLAAGNVEIALYVQPKQIEPDSSLTFLADSAGRMVEKRVTLGQDRYFRSTLICPLSNKIQLSMEREKNGVQEVISMTTLDDELDKSKLACRTEPLSQWQDKDLKYIYKHPNVTLSLAEPLSEKSYYGSKVSAQSACFLFYQNEQMVRSYPAALENIPSSVFAYPIWAANCSFDFSLKNGEYLTLVCEITDNYGRISYTLVDQWSVLGDRIYSTTHDLNEQSQLNLAQDYFGIPIDFTGRGYYS